MTTETRKLNVIAPKLPKLNLTGAAARSVAAADQAGDDCMVRMQAACDRIAAMLDTTPDKLDATYMIELAEAWRDLDMAKRVAKTLSPRWQTLHVSDVWSTWAAVDSMGSTTCFGVAVRRAFEQHRQRLVDAGVPMPELPDNCGDEMAEYWRDAAARGC